MHNFDKNEESKQLKPWPSSLIYSLRFLHLIIRCRHIQSESTAVLLKYDEKNTFYAKSYSSKLREDILLSCEN